MAEADSWSLDKEFYIQQPGEVKKSLGQIPSPLC